MIFIYIEQNSFRGNEDMSIFKITLLGDAAVGKTSLRKKFMGLGFKNDYMNTIGAEFSVYKSKYQDEEVTLHIWDIAGAKNFSSIIRTYYAGTTGAILAFDIARHDSFVNLSHWISELITNNGRRHVPIILVGNKSDLRDRVEEPVPIEFGLAYAQELSDIFGFEVPYVESSALNGNNVHFIFTELIKRIHETELANALA